MSQPHTPIPRQIKASSANRLTRQLITPEGVPLHLQLASAGDRAAAFLLDALFIGLILIGLTLVSVAAFSGDRQQVIAVIWLLAFFVLRNFYFSLFEIGPRAATPGKRILGLRVAARNGGRLTANAVIARNAMREIEIFLPLAFIAGGTDQIGSLIALLGLTWSGLFLLFPLFNRDRLRAGDFIAGTWVIRVPKQQLKRDVSSARKADDGFQFTADELAAYGIHELQVLEGVLRKNEPDAIQAVAERIRIKTGRTGEKNEDDRAFLNAYYVGLRQTLEAKLLFGVRRKDKHDKG